MFDKTNGLFTPKAVSKAADLAHMEVELEGGPGTALSHWDELRFDKELMTGYQDQGEHVLPITIEVMRLLGHKVNEPLEHTADLATLLEEAAGMIFSKQDELRGVDLDHYEETELFETIPHQPG